MCVCVCVFVCLLVCVCVCVCETKCGVIDIGSKKGKSDISSDEHVCIVKCVSRAQSFTHSFYPTLSYHHTARGEIHTRCCLPYHWCMLRPMPRIPRPHGGSAALHCQSTSRAGAKGPGHKDGPWGRLFARHLQDPWHKGDL